MATIGFAGLDIMGAHMTRNLLKGDHILIANGKHSVPEDPRLQAITAANSTAVAQVTDIIIAMMPDTPEVAEILLREDGVAQSLAADKLFIDMSSISPIGTQDLTKRVEALGTDYPDTPVPGDEAGAHDATLTTAVGGKEAAFERTEPLFTLMGKNTTYVGELSARQTCRVANRIIVALTIETMGETLLLTSKAEAGPARMRQVLMSGFTSLRILKVHGERMIKRMLDPSFHIESHQKDLNPVSEGARKLGIALSNTAATRQLFNVCVVNGGKVWDCSVTVHALESMADHTIA